jgi:hypothetical protein
MVMISATASSSSILVLSYSCPFCLQLSLFVLQLSHFSYSLISVVTQFVLQHILWFVFQLSHVFPVVDFCLTVVAFFFVLQL